MNMNAGDRGFGSRNYKGRKTWSHTDTAQLKAAIEAQGFSFEEEIDITIQLTMENFAGVGSGPMAAASRRSRFVNTPIDFEIICASTGRSREQILNKMREIARKELGISGGQHSKNIAQVKEFARMGARTLTDIEDLRAGRRVASMVAPAVGIVESLGKPSVFFVDVTPYLANVTRKTVVDKDSFCREVK